MSYLIVVAHPDDEVLGAGGTIYKLASQGFQVNVCIMSGNASARANRPDDSMLTQDTNNCMKSLLVNKTIIGDFPNIEMNTVPHLALVQFIENAIIECDADIIITHHPNDLNNDHLQTSLAAQAAVRVYQRRNTTKKLRGLYFMEIPSSTDWALNTSVGQFRADTYIEVGEDCIEKKLQALAQYQGVMREYPHPRSREAIKGLAAMRGAQSSMKYAEAFECAYRGVFFDN